MKLRRGVAAAGIQIKPWATSDERRRPRAKGEGEGVGEEGGLDRNRGRSDSERRRGAGNIDRRGGQVMQDLADLAAVCVVSGLRRTSVVFENRRRQMSGER